MKKILKVVINISFVFYFLALVYLLFLGTRSLFWSNLSLIEYIKNSSNVVPFRTINTYILALFNGSMNVDIPIKNLFGNLIMFLPMGIYLPHFSKYLNRISTFTITMILILLVIEIIQVVTRLGSFDIDDFILNMLGAYLGVCIWNIKVVQQLIK